MSMEEHLRKLLDDPNVDDFGKDDIRTLLDSHLQTGMNLQRQGLLREAIGEFAKEHTRSIKSDIDAEIVQTSYWHVGRAYRKLGELDKAIAALQTARELLKKYGVGSSPHVDLAEIFIELGRLDEAIEVCQELLKRSGNWNAKQLLAKAIAMKEGKSE